jgi:hypothetical protein
LKRLGLALGVSLLALVRGQALACPCSDDAGGASGLTRADERYAMSLVGTSRRALGRFDALGRYSALGAQEGETSEELLLRVALRLPQRIEWLTEVGFAEYRFHAPRVLEQQAGFGDALFHARYSLFDEGMPHERPWWPALNLSALLRAPLGVLSASRAASFGSGGAQLGLGAWELGGGLEAKRTLLPKLELLLGGEAAYRFEDHVLGPDRPRKLGPRADVALGARILPAAWFSSSVALRLRLAGDVSLSGRRLEGTSERLGSVVVGGSVFDAGTRLRSSLTFSIDPPLAGFSRGSTSAAALSVALGYGGN